jgi:hypothetical protein
MWGGWRFALHSLLTGENQSGALEIFYIAKMAINGNQWQFEQDGQAIFYLKQQHQIVMEMALH